MEVTKLEPRHIRDIRAVTPCTTPTESLLGDYAFAGLRDGKTVVIAGIQELWKGRGHAWFYAGELSKREWLEVTRLLKEGIEKSPYGRIEITVLDKHDAGHRWARKLGFKPEAFCRKYMPSGEDGWIYSIVREL